MGRGEISTWVDNTKSILNSLWEPKEAGYHYRLSSEAWTFIVCGSISSSVSALGVGIRLRAASTERERNEGYAIHSNAFLGFHPG